MKSLNYLSIPGLGYKLLMHILCITTLIFTALIVYQVLPDSHSAHHEDSLKQSNSLTTKEYNQIVNDLSTIISRESPKESLSRLSMLMDTNPKVLRECHGMVHEIGRLAYKKYGDFATAISYQDDVCGSGYLHGAIEEYFSKTKDINTAIKTICSQYGLAEQTGKCYHGVGHGLMYYNNNDLPTSVKACRSYSYQNARISCAEGVYMENFGTLRSLHPSNYLKPDDPTFPCKQQPSSLKGACYYYAPLYYLNLHEEDYAGALHMCSHVEKPYQKSCVKGVGSRIIKQHINNARLAETACMNTTDEQRNACIDGIVSYYLVNFHSAHQANVMCNSLTKHTRAYCLHSVTDQKYLSGE